MMLIHCVLFFSGSIVFVAMAVKTLYLVCSSGEASSKFWGAEMFDFRRATVFLFGAPLLKAQHD